MTSFIIVCIMPSGGELSNYNQYFIFSTSKETVNLLFYYVWKHAWNGIIE